MKTFYPAKREIGRNLDFARGKSIKGKPETEKISQKMISGRGSSNRGKEKIRSKLRGGRGDPLTEKLIP